MGTFENAPRITPFLWFDSNAEEAVSIFKNSRRLNEVRVTDGGPGPKGSILTIAFELNGQKFTALNGSPTFRFTEAISFVVRCDSQEEIDHYWSKLSVAGNQSQCGWLRDRFGLSWQIVPARVAEYVKNPKAMHALMKMKKLDIADLENAIRS